MDVWREVLALLTFFSNCFTKPSFKHFKTFIQAHSALLGLPHCITEVMRITGIHQKIHWNTPYAFLKRAAWSCRAVSQCLLNVLVKRLAIGDEIVLAIDDTLVKKWGNKFFGLGYYVDPTDKNPGASRRRVKGHCWVALTMLWEKVRGEWYSFPLSALLFIPEAVCPDGWPFKTKIELAEMLLKRFFWPSKRILLLVDNLYAKASLAFIELKGRTCVLVSRLRSNAALYEKPGPRKKGQRGRPAIRGKKVGARQLYRRRSKRQILKAHIYGKTVTIDAFIDVLIPSRTLGATPILVVIFPQRGGKKMNIFFSTDLDMEPTRLLELYAARFKIEDSFDELKTVGGLSDYRTRSFKSIKRHVTLTLVAHSLLRLLSVTLTNASTIEKEPWWRPSGPPSVTRLRRAVAKSLRISFSSCSEDKVKENQERRPAA